jgi:hypothetical protein
VELESDQVQTYFFGALACFTTLKIIWLLWPSRISKC